MAEMTAWLQRWLPQYLLVFIRLSGMAITLPILSYAAVLPRIRILFALLLAAIVLPMLPQTAMVSIQAVPQLIYYIARELMIGLIIGFGAKLIFEGFTIAGEFAARQIGLAMANVFDPASEQQVPIISQFWTMLLMVYFLSFNGHHFLIRIMVQNFTTVPPGEGVFSSPLAQNIVLGGSRMFIIAVRLAIPVIALLMIVDAGLALVARVMPQMNVYFVALPLKLCVGMFALISSLNIFEMLFQSIYSQLVNYLGSILYQLSGA